MKNKIQSRLDFADIEDNLICLLQAIKEHVLNDQESCYYMAIVLKAQHAFLSTRLKKNESLQE